MHPHADYYQSNLFPRNWKDMKILNGTLFEIKKMGYGFICGDFFFLPLIRVWIAVVQKIFQ